MTDLEPVCLKCHGPLATTATQASCVDCGLAYELVDGIPIMCVLAESDPGTSYKRRQIDFFDSEAAEFEITRPQRQPRLYGWLMAEKFRRSVEGVAARIPGSTLLTVCGGSGMDAEFLARAGAHVIASDLSLGAVQRAVERGHRSGLPIAGVVADAEHLPFRDRSVDIVYVHDGLHHLSDPMVGVAEMCRVARDCVLITEPSLAKVTALAVRLGIAEEVEDAGNRVERVASARITDHLAAEGFIVCGAGRYAMYYQHDPGRWMRFFSRRRAFPIARRGLTTLNFVFGPIGNKIAIRATRRDETDPPRFECRELPEVRAGRLPRRYGYAMQEVLWSQLRPLLKPGIRILDVGSGRNPSISPEERPSECQYIGLDISAAELASAPEGVYDDTLVHDITQPLPPLEKFDLVVSWQVLEHVKPLGRALENLRAVLRPGGTMLAQVSGTFSAFALLARVVPHSTRVWAMTRYLGHAEEEKFPTRYEHCWASAIERLCSDWSSVSLYPFYRGATYFGMSAPMQRAYLKYESAVAAKDVRNLATHYLVVAQR